MTRREVESPRFSSGLSTLHLALLPTSGALKSVSKFQQIPEAVSVLYPTNQSASVTSQELKGLRRTQGGGKRKRSGAKAKAAPRDATEMRTDAAV